MSSTEAEQMRFNNRLREGRDIVTGFGNELVRPVEETLDPKAVPVETGLKLIVSLRLSFWRNVWTIQRHDGTYVAS